MSLADLNVRLSRLTPMICEGNTHAALVLASEIVRASGEVSWSTIFECVFQAVNKDLMSQFAVVMLQCAANIGEVWEAFGFVVFLSIELMRAFGATIENIVKDGFCKYLSRSQTATSSLLQQLCLCKILNHCDDQYRQIIVDLLVHAISSCSQNEIWLAGAISVSLSDQQSTPLQTFETILQKLKESESMAAAVSTRVCRDHITFGPTRHVSQGVFERCTEDLKLVLLSESLQMLKQNSNKERTDVDRQCRTVSAILRLAAHRPKLLTKIPFAIPLLCEVSFGLPVMATNEESADLSKENVTDVLHNMIISVLASKCEDESQMLKLSMFQQAGCLSNHIQSPDAAERMAQIVILGHQGGWIGSPNDGYLSYHDLLHNLCVSHASPSAKTALSINH